MPWHESEYRGHPFRVSGIFPSTYHQWSVHLITRSFTTTGPKTKKNSRCCRLCTVDQKNSQFMNINPYMCYVDLLSKCMLVFFARFLTVTRISFSNVDSQLAGVGLIALGVWAHLERSKFNLADITSMFDFLTDVSIFFIITGCLMFMLGFCGCLGALRENTCLIKIVSEKCLSYQEYFEMNMSLQVVVERCLPYKDCKREKRWLYKDSSYTMWTKNFVLVQFGSNNWLLSIDDLVFCI